MQLYPQGPEGSANLGRWYIPDGEPGTVRWSGPFGFIDFSASEARLLAAILIAGAEASERAQAAAAESQP
jgi:hypothetical protein